MVDSNWAHLSFDGADILQLTPDLSVLDLSILNLYKPAKTNLLQSKCNTTVALSCQWCAKG